MFSNCNWSSFWFLNADYEKLDMTFYNMFKIFWAKHTLKSFGHTMAFVTNVPYCWFLSISLLYNILSPVVRNEKLFLSTSVWNQGLIVLINKKNPIIMWQIHHLKFIVNSVCVCVSVRACMCRARMESLTGIVIVTEGGLVKGRLQHFQLHLIQYR